LGGSYTFTPPSGLVFGPLHSTRAACPPGSLYDRVGKDMPYVRAFILKEGHLYLSLMADGGIYHFSPLP
jgi:para-nitrobenzyl esterase